MDWVLLDVSLVFMKCNNKMKESVILLIIAAWLFGVLSGWCSRGRFEENKNEKKKQ